MFYDYFMFTEPRTSYSVSTDGFQPQSDVLGGPAQPRQDDIMLVESDEALLLRGTIKRTYTGSAWTDSTLNNRYLYICLLYTSDTSPTRSRIRSPSWVSKINVPSSSISWATPRYSPSGQMARTCRPRVIERFRYRV